MKNKNLIVLESIHLKPLIAPEANSITTGELGQWVRSGKIFSQLFKYKEVYLLASKCHLLNRPFLCALTLKLLSRGKCCFKDIQGTIQPITLKTLSGLFIDFVRDLARIPFRLRDHHKTVRILESTLLTKEPAKLNLKHPPLYLRTDLAQGVLAGGSISHTAGVVNNLHHFASAPVILSTVHVPDLRSNALYEVNPDTNNKNFTDILLLESNEIIFEQCRDKYADYTFSFIYHRYSPYNYSGVVFACHFHIPLIMEYNGPEAWVGQNWTTGLKYEQLAKKIEILNAKAADVVVVVSQPLKSQLVERGAESGKILVNPNGVDPEIYSPEVDGSDIRRKHSLEDKIVVGFIGTFGQWHGAEVLVKAYGLLLQNHPNLRNTTRLLMIGDGVSMAEVKDQINNYNISEQVTLTGIIPQKEGPSHLAACDLLVSPHVPNPDGTPFFGSPTKLFEYMAMGKGIVASDLDQIGEVLEHDRTAWMVKPGDAESLMLGLKTMIDNPEIPRRLGEAARREVVAKYTWKEHTRKIIDKLKERCPCD